MPEETKGLPEICFHAIFADYDDAFIYAWNNYLNVHIHETDDGKTYYEVY